MMAWEITELHPRGELPHSAIWWQGNWPSLDQQSFLEVSIPDERTLKAQTMCLSLRVPGAS